MGIEWLRNQDSSFKVWGLGVPSVDCRFELGFIGFSLFEFGFCQIPRRFWALAALELGPNGAEESFMARDPSLLEGPWLVTEYKQEDSG